MTLTVSIEQLKKVNLFKPNAPQRQKHRFVSHSPYCPVVRLNGPRAYIRTPLYYKVGPLNMRQSTNQKNYENLITFMNDVKILRLRNFITTLFEFVQNYKNKNVIKAIIHLVDVS